MPSGMPLQLRKHEKVHSKMPFLCAGAQPHTASSYLLWPCPSNSPTLSHNYLNLSTNVAFYVHNILHIV